MKPVERQALESPVAGQGSFTHDLIVVGCGPAGMSAAIEAARLGLHTLLLDEQAGPGGQIYRGIEVTGQAIARVLGPDYRYGASVSTRLRQADVDYQCGAMVWDIAQDSTVSYLQGGVSKQVRGRQLVLATGALERATPIPGWTLPGVLNAGAAQIALKSAGSIPAGRIVVAGSGPLLLLVACQLMDAGANVVGLVETAPSVNRWRALKSIAGALAAPSYLLKGLGMLRRLKAARILHFVGASLLKVEGDSCVRTFVFNRGHEVHRIEAETVLLHHGVVPNTQVGRLLRLDHFWSDAQMAWLPKVDAFGATSRPGIRVAGDGAAIGGARVAEASGALAAIGAAKALGRIDGQRFEQSAAPWQAEMRRQLRIRPFLEALYRPPEWLSRPADDTIVCRCEEVTAGRIREMAQLGCQGPNQTKFFSRCGMGPCQGRICGSAVTQILAASLKRRPDEVGAYRVRSPLKPVPLGALASMAGDRPSSPPPAH
jgi:NADPH-dependent 2,4-dienoyl-CoA reductase/sulfur reductase-like enzyme